jgi:hypothetical protein
LFKKLNQKIIDHYLESVPQNDLQQLLSSILKDKVENSDLTEDYKKIADFYQKSRKRAGAEKEKFLERLDSENLKLDEISSLELAEAFFPEHKLNYSQKTIENLREQRKLKINKLNDNQIEDPFAEILFASNILLTMPADFNKVNPTLREKLNESEKQQYFYDHPIPLDIDDQKNEIIYGLKHLNQAVKAETDQRLDLLLSISVTHPSINKIAREYIESKLENIELEHLNIYLFTENESEKLLEEFILPFISDGIKASDLKSTVGAAGSYGRHYSFLKAVALWWQKYINSDLKATFKIDLDQVFDQQKLKEETGHYAFENFKSPLWGARAVDSQGRRVELGMIAGQLVNDSDIEKSIYELDIKRPKAELKYDQYIFFKAKPQYISTAAEMGYRADSKIDTILRYHVTGGTNGILIKALKKYKPFCPTFIGRAEDQAYLLSVLFEEHDSSYLRYYHQDGLIMRHDKKSFIGTEIKNSKISKLIGDYERIIIFSHYVRNILNDYQRLREELFPFTAAFISQIPVLLIYYRSILKAYQLAESDENQALDFLTELTERLEDIYNKVDQNYYQQRFLLEKKVWNEYYQILDDEKVEDQKLLDGFTTRIKIK